MIMKDFQTSNEGLPRQKTLVYYMLLINELGMIPAPCL